MTLAMAAILAAEVVTHETLLLSLCFRCLVAFNHEFSPAIWGFAVISECHLCLLRFGMWAWWPYF